MDSKERIRSRSREMAPAYITAIVLLAALAIGSPGISIMPEKAQVVAGNETAELAAVDVTSMQNEFRCSCCGKNIGECECGMAKERRDYLAKLAVEGRGKRAIYKAMVKQYTAGILFNEALAAEIKQELVAEAPADRPILTIEPGRIDAGEVRMAKGLMQAVYQVTNTGQSGLDITGLETSCMCTTAKLVMNGTVGPVFGMHDNPTDWSQKLEPGEQADLVVMFDPNAHGPEAVGPVTRTITVHSNDVIDAVKQVKFEAVVVK